MKQTLAIFLAFSLVFGVLIVHPAPDLGGLL